MFTGSTSLFWRSSQQNISMNLGKLHAVSSRQQDVLWVKTTHIPLYSTKWSARKIFRGWNLLMPRDPQSHLAKAKVLQETYRSIMSFYISHASTKFCFFFCFYFFVLLQGVKRKAPSIHWNYQEESKSKVIRNHVHVLVSSQYFSFISVHSFLYCVFIGIFIGYFFISLLLLLFMLYLCQCLKVPLGFKKGQVRDCTEIRSCFLKVNNLVSNCYYVT